MRWMEGGEALKRESSSHANKKRETRRKLLKLTWLRVLLNLCAVGCFRHHMYRYEADGIFSE